MKVFAENRKARNSYEFLEFFDAGVVLTVPKQKVQEMEESRLLMHLPQ